MIEQPEIGPHPKVIGDYLLKHNFIYQWKVYGQNYKLIIPAGFDFDLASVPQVLWTPTGISPDRLRWTAPLIHDFLYEYRGNLPKGSYKIWDRNIGGWVDSKDIWTRKEADKMFCRLMREDGISRFKRRMAYRAVRLGGWYAWKT